MDNKTINIKLGIGSKTHIATFIKDGMKYELHNYKGDLVLLNEFLEWDTIVPTYKQDINQVAYKYGRDLISQGYEVQNSIWEVDFNFNV